jgi:hypothetical protein
VTRLRTIALERLAVERGGSADEWPRLIDDDDYGRITALVKRVLGRPRQTGTTIDDGFLKDMMYLYESEGVGAVTETYDVTERTVRRWIAEARRRHVTGGQ